MAAKGSATSGRPSKRRAAAKPGTAMTTPAKVSVLPPEVSRQPPAVGATAVTGVLSSSRVARRDRAAAAGMAAKPLDKVTKGEGEGPAWPPVPARSEEHTSELQSR